MKPIREVYKCPCKHPACDKFMVRGVIECQCGAVDRETAQLIAKAEATRQALKGILDNLPFGLTQNTTTEITVHNASGGSGTMGPNSTRELIAAIKMAEAIL